VEGIVDSAGSYGLFSLLDHHQDAYSTKVCGTGFPDWTVADTDDKW
jgi:endoglycosylceramidase